MPTDLEIARAATLRPIADIAAVAGIPADALVPYGRHMAKIEFPFIEAQADKSDGALVLVTGISPTPAGEGKTTTTIGLGDALNRLGTRSMICLREPSLGPCFGVKGGATGGGMAQVAPMDRDQPAFHRRFPRHHHGQQPAGRDGRQPASTGAMAKSGSTRAASPGAARWT